MTGWSYMQLGLDAARGRRASEAAAWFGRSLDGEGDTPSTRAWLGQALCKDGEHWKGLPHLRAAAARYLHLGAAEFDLGKGLDVIAELQRWGDYEGALPLCRAATAAGTSARAQQLLAVTCGQLNLTAEALDACAVALAMDPGNMMVRVLQASLQADAGDLGAARLNLRAILAERPGPREALRAHKELARVLDELGDYGAVFPNLEAAAELAAQLPEYRAQDPRLIPGLVDACLEGVDEALMRRWRRRDFAGERAAPAFIMGFFRSGTTLTQQVLGANPGVFVADESGLVWEVQKELHRLDTTPGSVPDKLRRLTLDGAKRLRRTYWRLAAARYGEAACDKVFVDKNTLNIVHIALINAIFPDARVIFMVRDPRDVCLSCILQLMTPTPATVHLLTWRGTAWFYAKVMEWWLEVRDLLTLPVAEIRYEDAVTDFEDTYRRIFAFLGLPWTQEAANFHTRAAGRSVASPSRNQVARPLHGRSVARWRRYAERFDQVSDLLEPYVLELGYAYDDEDLSS